MSQSQKNLSGPWSMVGCHGVWWSVAGQRKWKIMPFRSRWRNARKINDSMYRNIGALANSVIGKNNDLSRRRDETLKYDKN